METVLKVLTHFAYFWLFICMQGHMYVHGHGDQRTNMGVIIPQVSSLPHP